MNEKNLPSVASHTLATRTLATRKTFFVRFFRNFLIGIFLIVSSLGIGMAGYHYIEGLSWIDAYQNAAMILSGMGPVDTLKTFSGKLFAGTYALFSGILFLVVVACIFAPVVHRLFHKFNIEDSK